MKKKQRLVLKKETISNLKKGLSSFNEMNKIHGGESAGVCSEVAGCSIKKTSCPEHCCLNTKIETTCY